ncbi:MAG: substrate-binding domain-containing protein [Firmicutes bacterium]|nr:substrate-binding domain-containing protein [Bacillota bacterium]
MFFLQWWMAVWLSHRGIPEPSAHIAISGSSALLPVIKEELPRWEARHPKIRVSITGGGSWAGLAAVLQGRADIGMSDIEPPQVMSAAMLGYPLGRLPVLFIGNCHIGVNKVSPPQLQRLLVGDIGNWRQVGGENTAVIVVSRPLSSGARFMIERQILKGRSVSPRAIIQLSNGALYKTVMGTPGALGYVEWRPDLKGVVVMAVGSSRFDLRRRNRWPYYTEPTLYVRKSAPAIVKQLASDLSRSPTKAQFGIYPAQP